MESLVILSTKIKTTSSKQLMVFIKLYSQKNYLLSLQQL